MLSDKDLKDFIKGAKVTADDATALKGKVFYREWEKIEDGAEIPKGERVQYTLDGDSESTLYTCLDTHNKQESWNPKDAPSLFAKVLIPDPEVIPEWEQPESTNGYSKGDKVKHNDKTWESLVDNNIWEPGVVGTETLWKEV